MPTQADTMEKIVALCRRRGFIFGSSEIYGGIGGFWDYGPLGTELKRNIKEAWWEDMVRSPPVGPNGVEFQMVGVDCSIIMNPKVWEASGHVGGFSDPMVDCKACKARFRADSIFVVPFARFDGEDDHTTRILELDDELRAARTRGSGQEELRALSVETRRVIETLLVQGLRPDYVKSVVADDASSAVFAADLTKRERKALGWSERNPLVVCGNYVCPLPEYPSAFGAPPCPTCGKLGTLTEPRDFNLMFESHTGAVRDDSAKVYLRPETAQGIFVNFPNVVKSSRVRIPFGIAQIGKAFRNEINPRNYTFRSREFEQYEIEFFCHESEAAMWYEFWRDVRHKWYVDLGLKSEKLRLREHEGDELAHYAESCADVEYDFPFGLSELEGIANRTDFDLKAHIEKSGKDLSYFDDQRKERYVPYVIEPSGGVDRSVLAFITEAYTVDENRASPEFMNFHPRLSPVKAAVFPLVAKDGLPEIAEPIYREIRRVFPCQYDAKQSIGKRYARMDEAGTPFCFTIDGQTKEDDTLTVRDRNDASQIRIDKSRCVEYLRDKLRL
ncbi:MAG: glycine--tRNA ligase [Phycisphaerae bacterium]